MRAALLVLAMFGCHSPDECERGAARLARLDPALGSAGKWTVAPAECKDGHYTGYDPVLLCAIDSSSDAQAAACIDAFVKAVVKPGATGGSGLNPLLQP